MSGTLDLEVDHHPANDTLIPPPPPPAAIVAPPRVTSSNPHAFKTLLDDAITLLKYANEAGITVAPEIAQPIITAMQQHEHAAWADPSAGNLFHNITRLSAQLHPVTAATLRATKEKAHTAINNYKRTAIILAAFIIPWSILSFIFTGINTSIAADIATANRLVVSLHGQLEPSVPPAGDATLPVPLGALSDLQEFAATTRSIYRHTRELTWFVPIIEKDPVTSGTRLELDTDLLPQSATMRKNLDELTAVYQQIRSYAKSSQDDGAAAYGAVTTCLLPIFYALLGACAYSLRSFSNQLVTSTFAPSYSTVARFVIAAIGGGVIGLFNFGTGQTATLSPLAIAFLAGYSADVFFSLIDGAVDSVTKAKRA